GPPCRFPRKRELARRSWHPDKSGGNRVSHKKSVPPRHPTNTPIRVRKAAAEQRRRASLRARRESKAARRFRGPAQSPRVASPPSHKERHLPSKEFLQVCIRAGRRNCPS